MVILQAVDSVNNSLLVRESRSCPTIRPTCDLTTRFLTPRSKLKVQLYQENMAYFSSVGSVIRVISLWGGHD